MVYFTVDDKKIPLGEELKIETDGRRLYFESEEVAFEKDYESVLEILCIMMWLMKHVKKTRVIFRDGEREFVRKREYQGYKGKLRL